MGGLFAKTLRPESLNQVDLPLEFGYCVIVRHAERLDDERLFGSQELEDRKYDYGVDTPLSLEGMEQSVKTGEYLKSFPNIRVFSSPFTRCIQTAAGICKGSGANPEITILEELSEVHRFNSTAADISKLQVNRLGSD